MIQKMVDRIVDRQVKNKSIEQEDINIYKYGYFLLIEVLINLIISLMIGVVFRDIKTVVLFLVLYIPLRTYSGGWHADKLWKCTVISNLILVIAEIISNYCIEYIYIMYCVPLMILSGIYILVVSPVDTESKPLENEERKLYGKKVKIIYFLHLIILILFIFFQERKGILILEYVYMVQAIMLIMEKMNIKMNKKVGKY